MGPTEARSFWAWVRRRLRSFGRRLAARALASRPARSLIALRWWLTERPRLLLAWAVLLGVPLAVPVLAFAWLRWCLCCWRVLFGG